MTVVHTEIGSVLLLRGGLHTDSKQRRQTRVQRHAHTYTLATVTRVLELSLSLSLEILSLATGTKGFEIFPPSLLSSPSTTVTLLFFSLTIKIHLGVKAQSIVGVFSDVSSLSVPQR